MNPIKSCLTCRFGLCSNNVDYIRCKLSIKKGRFSSFNVDPCDHYIPLRYIQTKFNFYEK